MDYKYTPSFYTNEEFFQRYLGKTSYYVALQNIVDKIIQITSPKKVLELGSALGNTLLLLSDKHENIQFVGIDIREDVITQAQEKALENCSFFAADMCEVVRKSLADYDLIFLLYSFHHIVDPIENKEQFLSDCYANMKKNSYLLIAESFLPEEIVGDKEDQQIKNWFKLRETEGYASTFWESLFSIQEKDIALSRSVAQSSKTEEAKAGDLVYARDNEYLVKFSWLKEICEKIGFQVVLAEPVNCIHEMTILLRR